MRVLQTCCWILQQNGICYVWKELIDVPNIKPISDLRNYSEVLHDVAVGAPVFLTKNGRVSRTSTTITTFTSTRPATPLPLHFRAAFCGRVNRRWRITSASCPAAAPPTRSRCCAAQAWIWQVRSRLRTQQSCLMKWSLRWKRFWIEHLEWKMENDVSFAFFIVCNTRLEKRKGTADWSDSKKLDKNSTQKLFKQPKGLAVCESQAAGPLALPWSCDCCSNPDIQWTPAWSVP